MLGVIPAYNEVDNLAAVIADVRRFQPSLDIVVIDDGSTDGSASLLPTLGVRWLSFPERLGIGSAMRAGIRYASACRLPCLCSIGRGWATLRGRHRGAARANPHGCGGCRAGIPFRRRAGGRVQDTDPSTLARRLPLVPDGSRVTDPTSGFCAFGPRALRVLAEHHPTGYPEPELRLFLSRNRLRTIEVPVAARPRLGGKTSLTLARLLGAGARVFLAMVIVPLRRQVRGER